MIDSSTFASPPIFWVPDRLQEPDAWVGHIPFAFWIVDALKPNTLVELGTHSGNSYLAFCQAVQELHLGTSCFAIDTWQGDEHSGFYSQAEIFAPLALYHDEKYGSFSRLVRSTFDEANNYFLEGSIDLLHIDGLHTYEAVKHDFETWLPKLSSRGIVIFHDINVREREFGVWMFWNEVSKKYPNFSFLHSHGLGILGIGDNLSEPLQKLFAASNDPQFTDQIRSQFSRLGSSLAEKLNRERKQQELSAKLVNIQAKLQEENLIKEQLQKEKLITKQQKKELEDLSQKFKKLNEKIKEYEAHIASIENSKAWKLTAAIRKMGKPVNFLKPILKKGLKFVYKLLTKDDLQIIYKLEIELAILVPDRGIFLQGWIADPDSQGKGLTLKVNNGTPMKLKPELIFSNPRPDIYKAFKARGIKLASYRVGFSCLVPLSVQIENLSSVTIFAEFLTGRKRRFSFPITQSTANPLPIIKQILNSFDCISPNSETCLYDCIAPTVSALWQRRNSSAKVQEIVEYGQQVNQPEVSVIVPLYGRIDFVKVQLSLFADDPDFQKNELIYILDDPRLTEKLQQLSSQLTPLFEVPFKVIYTGHNLGYAGANNLAITQAQGKYLILLNSDVMPKQEGWITALKTAYQSLPKVGAIAPKLLFEDESIQHAGIVPYRLPPYRYLWFNNHPGKGLPSSLITDTIPTQVPAVTGACLMVERELYLKQGGLSEDYILGDFEDSDFCFQLHQSGLQNYYIPSVEMYHLERQSQILIGESHWRQSLTLYNAWVYTKRWDSLIREMLVSQPEI